MPKQGTTISGRNLQIPVAYCVVIGVADVDKISLKLKSTPKRALISNDMAEKDLREEAHSECRATRQSKIEMSTEMWNRVELTNGADLCAKGRIRATLRIELCK
jgi:hypothetical protein